MTKDNSILLTGMFVVDTLWAVSLWRGWPERVYEQKKDSPSAWYWLSVFNIPQTKRNCVRFLQIVCIVGMALMTGSTLFCILRPFRPTPNPALQRTDSGGKVHP